MIKNGLHQQLRISPGLNQKEGEPRGIILQKWCKTQNLAACIATIKKIDQCVASPQTSMHRKRNLCLCNYSHITLFTCLEAWELDAKLLPSWPRWEVCGIWTAWVKSVSWHSVCQQINKNQPSTHPGPWDGWRLQVDFPDGKIFIKLIFDKNNSVAKKNHGHEPSHYKSIIVSSWGWPSYFELAT